MAAIAWRAWKPAPSTPRRAESGRASTSVATATAAAVRKAVSRPASMTASGVPVLASRTFSRPVVVRRPRAALSGCTDTTFTTVAPTAAEPAGMTSVVPKDEAIAVRAGAVASPRAAAANTSRTAAIASSRDTQDETSDRERSRTESRYYVLLS